MKAPPLGPGGEDITWPPGAERRLVPAKSNLKLQTFSVYRQGLVSFIRSVRGADEYVKLSMWR